GGIRVRNVTGVQTCALPIFSATVNAVPRIISVGRLAASIDEMVETFECDEPAHADDARHGIDGGRNWRRKTFEIDPVVNAMNFRSEERRVGKGSRSQWSREQ